MRYFTLFAFVGFMAFTAAAEEGSPLARFASGQWTTSFEMQINGEVEGTAVDETQSDKWDDCITEETSALMDSVMQDETCTFDPVEQNERYLKATMICGDDTMLMEGDVQFWLNPDKDMAYGRMTGAITTDWDVLATSGSFWSSRIGTCDG